MGTETYEGSQRERGNVEVLAGVQDCMRLRVLEWIRAVMAEGMSAPLLTSGRRSLESQVYLFGMGRSAAELKRLGHNGALAQPKKRKVTWCKPSESKHVKGLAVDWNVWEYSRADQLRIIAIARRCGLVSGDGWKVKDTCHLEYEGGVG